MPPRKRAATQVQATNLVDDTVKNQESLGSAEVVDRNPGQQLVEDPLTGAVYDISKAQRELVDPDADEIEARKNRVRQTESVLSVPEKLDKIEIEFFSSGFTVGAKVWKKGEVLKIDDSEEGRDAHKDVDGNYWYDQTADKQQERFGKVVFEKR